MIKDEGDNMGKAKDMGVISQGKENPQRTMQINVKMNQGKKRYCKRVALAGAHKKKNDKQNP